MKIIGLKAQNFMNLKLVDVALNGESMAITGDNGAGKTSLLNAFFSVFEGLKVCDPIRKGEDRAEIELRLGDDDVKFIVKQVFTPSGERLEVTTADGAAKYGSPRKFLEQFIDFISVDPGELAKLLRSSRKEDQRRGRDMLLDLVKLDLSKYDTEYAAVKETRSDAIAEKKRLEMQAETLREFDIDAIPDDEINIAKEMRQLAFAESLLDEYTKFNRQWDYLENEIADRNANITSMEEEIAEIQGRIDAEKLRKENLQKEMHSLKRPDVPQEIISGLMQEQIRDCISKAQDTNKMVSRKREYKRLSAEVVKSEEHISRLLQDMNSIEHLKQEALSKANFPIAGLSVDDNGVTYKGISAAQVSESELLRVATAILIARNPKLKLIVVRDGNAFTRKNLFAFFESAQKEGYQVLTEVCDDTGSIGVYIENGEVKKINGVETAPTGKEE